MNSTLAACSTCDRDNGVDSFCFHCRELHCDDCVEYHALMTKSHTTIRLSSRAISNPVDLIPCHSCEKQISITPSVDVCLDCERMHCKNCSEFHARSKAFREHRVSKGRDFPWETTRACKSDTLEVTFRAATEPIKAGLELGANFDSRACSHSEASIRPATEPIEGDLETSSDFESRTYSHSEATLRAAAVPIKQGQRNSLQEMPRHKMEFLSQIDVGTDSDDQEGCISGMAYLPDGRVVLTDFTNYCVKVFGCDYKYRFSIECSYNPKGLTVVSRDRVVVIEGSRLQYLQLDENSGSKLGNGIMFNGEALAVSFASETFAVLCTGKSNTVLLMDHGGTKRSTITLNRTPGHLSEFILLQEGGTRFYVCDKVDRLVLCYSSSAEELCECSLQSCPFQ